MQYLFSFLFAFLLVAFRILQCLEVVHVGAFSWLELIAACFVYGRVWVHKWTAQEVIWA
jgi:hypothetical protein